MNQYIIIYGESDFNVIFQGLRPGKIACPDGSELVVMIGSGDSKMGVSVRHAGERGWVVGMFKPPSVKPSNWEFAASLSDNFFGDSPELTLEVAPGTEVRYFVDGEELEPS